MIEPGYLHLLINHFPIVLGVVGAIASVIALILRRRSVWLFAVACLTLAGIVAQPVVITGGIAEDIMRDAWYMSRPALEEHEAAGKWARWALLLAGAAGAFAWWSLLRTPRTTAQQRDGRTGDFPGWLQALVIVTALLAVTATGRAAWLGGKLVHANATLAFPPSVSPAMPTGPTPPPTDTTAPVPGATSVPAESLPTTPDTTRRP